jgi:CRP/FNR family transcriptional regulator, cyclic AMP receptor protein
LAKQFKDAQMTPKESADEALARVPLFSHLGKKELGAVRELMTRIDLPLDQVLTRQDAHGSELFVILSGTASVVRDGQHISDVGPGDFIGEMSILDRGPRTATITATSDMIVLVATRQEFNSLLDRLPIIARQMLPALASRIRTLTTEHHSH